MFKSDSIYLIADSNPSNYVLMSGSKRLSLSMTHFIVRIVFTAIKQTSFHK